MPAPAPRRLLLLVVGLAGLLAACTSTGNGTATDPTTPPGARNALRVTMAGFAGGPGFTLPDDLRGRPLVLNVWASWCAPCRTEMPAFEQVHRQLAGKVTFLGLDYLDQADAARRFAAETHVTYRLASDPHGQAGAKLGVAGLPTTLFIAPDGTLRGRRVGAMTAEQLRAAITTYLHQKP
jgi:cytochrome c biogenesis protein CcmG, thiol:disulfide interchange protein DsbE